MERLTYMDGGKWRIRIGDTEYSGKDVDKIAAYEDLLDDYDLARLRELVTADKEGRCVIFRRDYPVMSEYAPADEDGLYTRTVAGVITQSEYESALAEKGEKDESVR